MSKSTYFANLVGDELASAVYDKVSAYRREIERNGRLGLWEKAYRAYYALDAYNRHEAAMIRRGGEQQELHLLKANHYRNFLTHLHVLTTQQRPAFECRATNTDYKSQLQTILGANILEYYMREKRLEEHFRRAAEFCLNYGEAFVTLDWDATKGESVVADEEGIIPTGDIVGRVYGPMQVARPCRADPDTELNWVVITLYINRYDLAAEYPAFADKIMSFSGDTNETDVIGYGRFSDDDDDDMIPVQVLYHDRTPACPTGRFAKCLGSQVTLVENTLDALRYKKMPVYRMAAYNQDGTSFGYTVAFDLLCVQEAIDIMYSTILSNQATFGVQNIWIKPGSTLYPSQLSGGLNVLESEEKPEPINLTYTPPEIFKFVQGLETLGEVLSGINSVARGQPEASLKSGSALAMVASQAVQFSNSISAAYIKLLEDVGTGVITLLQTRAAVPRTTAIAGKSNRSYIKEFVGDDIDSINRVVVEVVNPVSRTTAGRIQMAQDLLQAQAVTPQEYIQVITTGKLDVAIEDEQAETLLIRSENEDLREGRPVVVTAVDMHVRHINGHKVVFADPDARRDPAIMSAALAHIQEHIDALRNTDPALLNVLGQAPIAPGTPPQGANAPQDLPNQQPQEPTPGEQMPAPANSSPQIVANMPTLPKLPPGAPENLPQQSGV
jgi:hypothetical protein